MHLFGLHLRLQLGGGVGDQGVVVVMIAVVVPAVVALLAHGLADGVQAQAAHVQQVAVLQNCGHYLEINRKIV